MRIRGRPTKGYKHEHRYLLISCRMIPSTRLLLLPKLAAMAMDLVLEKLLSTKAVDLLEHKAVIFNLPGDQEALMELLKAKPSLRVYDRIEAQLRELQKALNPGVKFDENSLQEAANKYLSNRNLNYLGSWVYYPWSQALVHLLGPEEFAIVRTDRNRNKITREEQAVLATKKVGVIGLSVGQSVSLAMALERSFGEIRLADFDTLDLSNLNRIRSGTRNLGMNKAVITAREIAELDPYLKVTCFTDGLTRENMDAFYTEGGPLDILVEECDSVDIKILARQKARELRIPVVMDMSDRGCLDVERFDLEPTRPLMHGWIDHLDLDAAQRPMTAEEKVPYMLPITGVETLSPRMKASVIELGQTIGTWPQLATSVVLGGALAGDAVRRILLGQFSTSGRWHVDLEEQIADPAAAVEMPAYTAAEPFHINNDRLSQLEEELGPVGHDALRLDTGTIEQLVEAGGMAPSAGNMQPWKFIQHNNRLLLFHDKGRSRSMWDPDDTFARIALGACMENVVLKAHALGLEVALVPGAAKNNDLIAAFEFTRTASNPHEPHLMDALAGMIGMRHTNRKLSAPEHIPEASLERLQTALHGSVGLDVRYMTDRQGLAQLGGICAMAQRIKLLHPESRSEYFGREVRWKPEEAAQKRDGIALGTLELHPAEQAMMHMSADPRAMDLLDRWGLGANLGMRANMAAATASAMGLVSCDAHRAVSPIAAGRAVQRLWLAAQAEDLAIQPIMAPVQLLRTLDIRPTTLRKEDRHAMEQARSAFRSAWQLQNREALFMFRIAKAGPPAARSLRLHVNELLQPSPQ